jgi:hypothetical protein
VWTGTGCSITKIRDIFKYVFVRNRMLRFSEEEEELEENTSLTAYEWGCAITVQGFGTATLFKRVLSATIKPVSEKCWLHTYRFCSVLVCSALQDMPNLSAHSCALCNNEITN